MNKDSPSRRQTTKIRELSIVICIAERNTEFRLDLDVNNGIIRESDEENYLSSNLNTGRDEIIADKKQEESLSK